jgi:hypothetical protein
VHPTLIYITSAYSTGIRSEERNAYQATEESVLAADWLLSTANAASNATIIISISKHVLSVHCVTDMILRGVQPKPTRAVRSGRTIPSRPKSWLRPVELADWTVLQQEVLPSVYRYYF